LPLIHKTGHAVALDAHGQSFIGGAALLTPGRRGQAG